MDVAVDDADAVAAMKVLANARDAMPKGGTLTVRTYNVSAEESRSLGPEFMTPGEYVAVEVQDTGSGIPPEILNKIWEPFFSTKEQGSGIGLSLSRQIMNNHGGTIQLESHPGKSTLVRLIFTE